MQFNLVPKPQVRFCIDCDVELTEQNQYPSCRKRGQRCCKGCWNKRFYLAVRTHKYGISKTEFQALLVFQNGCCAICEKTMRVDGVCVDHDHDTLQVRGLLCRECNSGIGLLKDSPEILRKAIKYLENENSYMKIYRARKKEAAR